MPKSANVWTLCSPDKRDRVSIVRIQFLDDSIHLQWRLSHGFSVSNFFSRWWSFSCLTSYYGCHCSQSVQFFRCLSNINNECRTNHFLCTRLLLLGKTDQTPGAWRSKCTTCHESDNDFITVVLVICKIYVCKTSRVELLNTPRPPFSITDLRDSHKTSKAPVTWVSRMGNSTSECFLKIRPHLQLASVIELGSGWNLKRGREGCK